MDNIERRFTEMVKEHRKTIYTVCSSVPVRILRSTKERKYTISFLKNEEAAWIITL